MKTGIISLLLISQSALAYISFAQNVTSDPTHENAIAENDAGNPCISEQEYALIEKRCYENIKLLNIENKHSGKLSKVSVPLAWPLKAAASLKDCSFYYVSAYVDHNSASSAVQDFNCGTNTYDGHRGTDISTWPFNFLKMDNDLVEVIAAAPGVIIDKHDGEFDRNCSVNSLTANYVVIQHSDGSRAYYWHMKKNSVLSKAIGLTVATGEKLGVVGSSGSSSGPHLHFEVRTGSDMSTMVDPFSGTCNKLNSSSYWAAQKPYKETAVVKVSVNTTDIVVPPCPTTETPNESSSYQIPFQGPGLAPGYAKFYIFIRNEVSGMTADLSILNPDATTFSSWTYNSPADSKTKMWGFSKKLPTIAGKYTFKATYNGTSCSSIFDVVTDAAVASIGLETKIKIYPNPSNGKFIIELENSTVHELEIYNVFGDKAYQSAITNPKTEITTTLQSGLYFYQLKDDNGFISSGKLMVQ